jgi:putative ABC transport system permease protein
VTGKPLHARPLLRLSTLSHLYRRRLRVHAAAELLAGVGISVGVALVFAVMVANGSILGSAREVIHKVTGPSSLQLTARNDEGFNERLISRVQHLAGVTRAAPVLEQTAALSDSHARQVVVEIAGADARLAVLDGLAHSLPSSVLVPGTVALSQTVAERLGVASDESQRDVIRLRLRGRSFLLRVSAVLGHEAAGALSQALTAVMPLKSLQRIASLPRRVTRILVESAPGREAGVRTELERLASGRLSVAPADQDVALLTQALRPSDQASEFFAAISALLGLLLAFNAFLLTVPERRRVIADLRISGARNAAIVEMVIAEALCLGVGASLVGVLGGYLLSFAAFHDSSPGYLAQAFVLGSGIVIGIYPALLAAIGGVLATCLASILPLLDLRRGRAIDAIYRDDGPAGNTIADSDRPRLFAIALALACTASVLFLTVPGLALVATILLALGMVLAIPLVFALVLRVAHALARRRDTMTLLPVALASLKGTGLRSLALISTGAIAIFGMVALGGARGDLLRGLRGFAQANVADGQLRVLNPGYTPETTSFPANDYASRITALPGVLRVHSVQSEFMNLANRRVVILARPPGTEASLLRSQLNGGSDATALRHLNAGGWVAVSSQLASEQHASIGQLLRFPSPTGVAVLRLAATTTNFGWPGGSILMNAADYRRLWSTSTPSALVVSVRPGSSVSRIQRQINAVLGAGSGLEAITAETWVNRFDTLAGQGLSRLGDISTLLLLAAIMAMAAALASHIWQQRASMASLRIDGVSPRRLRRLLLVESTLILTTGCIVGALAGVFGQLIIDRYLQHVTGFPVASLAAGWRPGLIVALVVMGAFLAVLAPGFLASRVSPALAFALDE